MTPKGWIVLGFLIVAAVCFTLVTFGHGDAWPHHDLVALGLLALTGAFGFHIFMRGTEVNP